MYGKPAWNRGIPRSEEVRKKISETRKGKYGRKGENHPMYGKPSRNRSPEYEFARFDVIILIANTPLKDVRIELSKKYVTEGVDGGFHFGVHFV